MKHSLLLISTLVLLAASAPRRAGAVPPPDLPPAQTLAMAIDRAGIVTLTAEQLAAAGWALASIDVRTIQLFHRAGELPLQLSGDDDRRLEPGEALQFVVAGGESPYTDTAVYRLVHSQALGMRAALPADPAQPLRWERDRLYRSDLQTARGDGWFAAELRAGAAPLQLRLDLPTPLPAGAALDLELVAPIRAGRHELTLRSGGAVLGAVAWDEAGAAPQTVRALLNGPLAPGPLELELALTSTGDEDAVLVDALSLPEALVPLPALAPALVTVDGRDFLRGPAPGQPGADTLIITHGDFAAALQPLVAAKTARGRSVAVIDVRQIYDAYSYGERDPEAIRAFIRTAAAHWSPAPRSVLLVGGGSARMRMQPAECGAQHTACAETTFIPPYLVDADPKFGRVPCDTCYTRLDDDDPRRDPLPDIAVGRLPVRTVEEAHVAVAKTVAYLADPPRGAWRQRALFLTDNDVEADGTPDRTGGFVEAAAGAAALLPAAVSVERLHYAPDRAAAGPFYHDAAALRARLREAWGEGAALLTYLGHSSPWQYGHTAAEEQTPYLWSIYDVPATAAGGRLPILLAMTCLSGDWANPTLRTLDEELLLRPDGGVVAALSPSGSGVNAGHRRVLEELLPRLFAPGSATSLGAAHLAGLAGLRAGGRDIDLAYSLNLLGDPDIALPDAAGASVGLYLPLVRR